jgi:drug/metabolite transporter (DMT)-like permease
MNHPLPRGLGIALLLVIAVVFGANHVAARLAFDHGLTVTTAVAIRSAGTAIAVLALLVALGAKLALPRSTLGRALGIGAILAVQSYCLYSAVARIPAALALLVFNVHPMLLTLLTWGTGGERPPARSLMAMPFALIGLALALDVAGSANFAGRWAEPATTGTASLPINAATGAGVAFALAAAVSFATAMWMSARWLHGIDGRLRSCLMMGAIAVLAFAAGAATDTLALPRDTEAWTGLALLTLLYGTAITSLFVLLPRLKSPTDIAALNFEPIAVLLAAWVLLGQSLKPMQIVGTLIVVGSIFVLGTGKR